ncbi:hypothetical protein [Pseudoalteromonas sp. PS5]|uniref:hypothetical protein n=1 Tax=Pseudoalteromonas sp. PS5 TaxID=1437473 RepID=UPI000FFF09AC|nr:hypothetical protein [Pseudoalteromonas sp. PS5]RXF05948.1 hypothetical protein D9603_02820 [Pseudoalteromonas sp. PS5]
MSFKKNSVDWTNFMSSIGAYECNNLKIKVTVRNNTNSNSPLYIEPWKKYRVVFNHMNCIKDFLYKVCDLAGRTGNSVKSMLEEPSNWEPDFDHQDRVVVSYICRVKNETYRITFQFGGKWGDGYVIDLFGFDGSGLATALYEERYNQTEAEFSTHGGLRLHSEFRKLSEYSSTHSSKINPTVFFPFQSLDLTKPDDICKIVAEGARWLCVRNAFRDGRLWDGTLFNWSKGRKEPILFCELWRQWQLFKIKGYYYNISDATVREVLITKNLKKTINKNNNSLRMKSQAITGNTINID